MISPISEAAYSKLHLNWGFFHTAVLQFNWAAVPQPMLVCSGQGGNRGLPPHRPLISSCGVPAHPWAPNSAPPESGWIASCHRPGAELTVLPALS